MRKMMVAIAATAALASGAFFAEMKAASAASLKPQLGVALENGNLNEAYMQRGGHGRGGGAVYRGGGHRGGGAYRSAGAYRGGTVYRGGAYRGGPVYGGRPAYRGGAVYGGRPAYVAPPYYRPGYARPVYGPRYGYYGRPYGYNYNYGAAAAAGAVGLATGAIIAGAAAQPQVYAPSNAQAYCAQRFRSYNPATGTYRGYDGRYHACP